MARKDRRQEPNALVAAAQRVRVDDAKVTTAQVRTPAKWQEEAWAFYDEVPEIKFAMQYAGNALSKVEFFAATLDTDGELIRVNDPSSPLFNTPVAIQAEYEMRRLQSERGGQGEINKQLTVNLDIAGECYLHGRGAHEAQDPVSGLPVQVPEQWEVRSRDEIVMKRETDEQNRRVIIIKTDPDAKDDDPEAVIRFDPDRDTLIRVWTRHPRYSSLAESHMRGLLSDCETLVLLGATIKAEAKSRLAAPILTLPKELNFQRVNPDAPDGQQQDDTDPFMDAMVESYTTAIEDPTSVASVAPFLLRGPKEYLGADSVRVINLGRVTDANTDQRIKDRIDRIARGLNLPVEVVMGHMSTTFSNAEQIDQDVFDDHLEPRCLTIADLYQSAFLRPQLRDALNVSPDAYALDDIDRVIVWFDASALVNDSTANAAADALYDRGTINAKAYRRLKGVSEDDAPDDNERLRALVERKGAFSADLTAALLRMVGVPVPDLPKTETAPSADLNPTQIPAEEPAPTTDMLGLVASAVAAAVVQLMGGGDADPKAWTVIEASARERLPLGRVLMEIDRDLRTRLLVAAEAAMERALERAGNRLKGKRGTEAHAMLRNVPAMEACAHVGRSLVAAAGFTDDELLTGAWDGFERTFREWVERAAVQAMDEVAAATGRKVTDRGARMERTRANIDTAWAWLSAQLDQLARDALFPPGDAAVEAPGERDPSARVPAGVMRSALGMAGGATFETQPLRAAAGIVVARSSEPIGGVATGPDMDEVLEENDLAVDGFVWVYGPAARKSYEPHLALDGVWFQTFDDDVLSNDEDWPYNPFFYPGDHDGCVCDFEPEVRELGASKMGIGEPRRHARAALEEDWTPSGKHNDVGARFARDELASRPELAKMMKSGDIKFEEKWMAPYSTLGDIKRGNAKAVAARMRTDPTMHALLDAPLTGDGAWNLRRSLEELTQFRERSGVYSISELARAVSMKEGQYTPRQLLTLIKATDDGVFDRNASLAFSTSSSVKGKLTIVVQTSTGPKEYDAAKIDTPAVRKALGLKPPTDDDLAELMAEGWQTDAQRAWAGASNNTPQAVLYQAAARDVHQIPATPFEQEAERVAGETWGEGKSGTVPDKDAAKAITKTEYELTQERFAAAGIKSVRLFRGARLPLTLWKPGEWDIGDTQYVRGSALSSWSANRADANMFAMYAEGQEFGVVYEADVPVAAIQCSSVSGRGCFDEGEFIVIGGAAKECKIVGLYHEPKAVKNLAEMASIGGWSTMIAKYKLTSEDQGTLFTYLLKFEEDEWSDWYFVKSILDRLDIEPPIPFTMQQAAIQNGWLDVWNKLSTSRQEQMEEDVFATYTDPSKASIYAYTRKWALNYAADMVWIPEDTLKKMGWEGWV